jgi:hypothetical protein
MLLDDYSDMRNCKRCEVYFRTAEDVEECSQCRSREVKASPVFDWNGLRRRTEQVTRASDPAAHYRHVIRTRITDEDIARGYTEIERCSCRAPRPMPDAVSQPSHYQSDDGVECIDAIRAALGIDGFVAHCRGTAIKYAWRSGKKAAHAEDLRKACVYLEWAAKAIEDN